jgi:gluconate 5-dehydrogenase
MHSLSLFDLTGKRALITGSSRGIGFALARGLAGAGAEVILNGRDEARLGEAAGALAAEGATVHRLPFDAVDHAAVKAAVDGFEAATGAIDILINNAGMQHRGPLEDFAPADFERLMQTNVTTVFNVGQAVARHMIARGKGRIVNICSVQSALARPGIAPYTASKGAVANLTKGMATDWARHGLQVNAALVADAEFTAWLAKRTPAGRWGKVEELVGAAIFLAGESASFVNGHILYVDGGITASL